MDKPFALILENDRGNAALFRHVLDVAGFRTEIVFNGQAAIERLAKSKPDIAILNLDLGGISGVQILELIRNDEKLSHCKIIAVTSNSIISDSLSTEPDLLLFTPVSIEQFSDLVERFQQKHKYQTTVPMIGEPWDRVTGLYNQFFFTNRLQNSLIQSREIDQYSFAIITVNIDQGSRVINQLDMRNWIIALRETAKALKATVRPTDTTARFDLDNFHILVENFPNQDTPIMMASRINKKLSENLTNLGMKVLFPIRIGILLCDAGYEHVEEILRDVKSVRTLVDAREDGLEYYDRTSIKTI